MPPLLKMIGKRLLSALVLLWGVTVVTFLLVNVVPGDAAAANLSQQAYDDPEIRAAFEAKWGLDQPIWVQYVRYLGNILQGDLGTSQQTHRPVAEDLGQYVPATIEIALPAMALAIVIAVGLGMLAAMRKNRPTDTGIRSAALVGLSTPPFWLALVALYVFFYLLGWVPNGGRLSNIYDPPPAVTGMYTVDAAIAGQWDVFGDALWHLVLPVGILTALTVSGLLRFVRSAMIEVLDAEYIRSAIAKGLPRRIITWRHVFRAGLLPVLTVSGLMLASLLGGAVLVEQVLSWPGLGQYAYKSAISLDLQAILGVTLFIAVVYTLINLLVDVLYSVIDPRIGAK
ncbi:ABC transporter permease [Agromyces mediolanus]|jgi:peptide/nickel transport system permease protein|uniref:Peptide ABC transporter permease n=1 Tax=Agromyces mediolanus TaxID=41986 RepID=A0A918F9I8_AGRME|nr:ABC transporter permease [Agromyces mediolanus]MCD1570440.1 ABC transporter permease [Agromyces mediolanus]GGR13257.1 peptide ABC transporter permease [Agromyces mediolanus]GLJ72628.1 peptide ABC transporter permease [Agromyces mediolanus]